MAGTINDRHNQPYASDGTDAERAVVGAFMPPKSKVGRPRRTKIRALRRDPRHRRDGMPVSARELFVKQALRGGDVARGGPALRDRAILSSFCETAACWIFSMRHGLPPRLLSGREMEPTAGITPYRRCFAWPARQRTATLSRRTRAAGRADSTWAGRQRGESVIW